MEIMGSKLVSNCKTTSVKMDIMGSKLVSNCKTKSVKMDIMNCMTVQDTVHHHPRKVCEGVFNVPQLYEHKGASL
jgi:hypothetical protein